MSAREPITVDRELIKDAVTWLARMVADGNHKACVMPGHCERTLQKLEKALYPEAGK